MRKRILVVDDEESIRFTFKRFLAAEGYEVDTAADFDAALDLIRSSGYDMMFADIVLGGRTGIDLLQAIRSEGVTCPVVMVTGVPTVDTAAAAMRLGAIDYIPKPFEKDTLLRTARMVLRHQEVLAEKERYRTHLEAIFRSVNDAVITVDRGLVVTQMNARTEEMLGVDRSIVGGPFDAMPGLGSDACRKALRGVIERSRSERLERLSVSRDGAPDLVLSLSVSPLLDEQEAVTGAVVVARDETRLADLERSLRDRRGLKAMVGRSRAMQEIYALIEDLAEVPSTVLVTGESGTGKELVVDALHELSPRSAGPLVKVNCSALSENLLESELFGHVRGAFTGALRDRPGRFELADGGTIFLDEIGDISAALQTRLLRVLQSREFERVGDPAPRTVDVRVVAATNRDLKRKVSDGSFREDLYYRLRVVELHLPPLRERREDIPLLVDHFLGRLSASLNKHIEGVSEAVLETFMAYGWPGNVRELEHTLEHAAILSRGSVIDVEHLPQDVAAEAWPATGPGDEESRLRDALERAGGNRSEAARLLGMSRSTFYRKLKEFDPGV
jgi:PAS domain S-box-containing protein